MTSVRIVGGGLAGLVAAFEAHRLGCRDIVLHERFDRLGGDLLPRVDHGVELRHLPFQFGPRGEPVRALLEGQGLAFEDFENRFASVSPAGRDEIAVTHDFAGPALAAARGLGLKPAAGDSLADRLRAYPDGIGEALTRYCQWRLGAWLDEVHESAAAALACRQVFPLGQDVAEVARLIRADRRCGDAYALPGSLCGRLDHLTASVPRGGFASFFAQARAALERLGVTVHENDLVSPRRLMAERRAGEALVWAADPTPLFDLAGLEPPRPLRRSTASYVFKARYSGRLPFQVSNFTAMGAVFGLHLYESRGQAMLLAECVQETPEPELRREVHRLMASFGGASLCLEALASTRIGPGRNGLTVDQARKLAALVRQLGAGFVPAWGEPRDIAPALAVALEPPAAAAVA